MRLPVAEIPTIWLDRPAGVSNFKLAQWLPKYLRWYRFAFGPRARRGEHSCSDQACRHDIAGFRSDE